MLSLAHAPPGRYIFIHALVGGTPLLIIASYIPPPYKSYVVAEGLAFIAQHPTIPAVWMGDFNRTMSPYLDRPP